MFTVISYDIVEDKRRTKIHKHLHGYGVRVQYSVFECDLNKKQLSQLQQELAALIDINTDSIRIYQLEADSARRTQILGIGRVSVEPAYYYVGG
ncbi:CRISPR-associated endonuclease Cas2 [Candidatus Oscillochloris fontis]|uniref:CRISPR-associated endonuclease Cas2 n=1 Tax=Candidatus Oscillochloris fontis TaxID=2496868 RepID=UPI00101C7EE0|nr:CRISPR-associated endonuclease Cas2 [Candidatus Oscillochloris fontis]